MGRGRSRSVGVENLVVSSREGGQEWQEGARSAAVWAWLLDGSGEGGMSGNREPTDRVHPHSDFAMCLCREFVLVE
jgi:hypothetical protein